MNRATSLEEGTQAGGAADRAEPDTRVSMRGEPARRVPHEALLRLGAVCLSAGLLTLASPPPDWGWLGWMALAPFFWALLQGSHSDSHSHSHSSAALPDTKRRRRASAAGTAAAHGFLLGFLFLILLVPWFAAFTPIGYPVAAVYWGLLTGAVAWLAARLIRENEPVWAPPLLAAAWTLVEWLRAQGVLSFPWGMLATTQHRYLPVIQVLDLCGAYGITFLMALFAASLAALVVPRFHAAGRQWGAGTAAVVLLCAACGFWLLHSASPPGATARVGLVQMSTSRVSAGAEVVCDSPIRDYVDGTRDALGLGAELVVWPECACESDLAHQPSTRAYLAQVLRDSRAHLLAGAFLEDPLTGDETNSAVMLSPEGAVLGQYSKVLIVPFGEYLPARPLLGWTAATGLLPRDLKAGRSFTPLWWARGKVGASICYESAFGKVSRGFVIRGANLLAVLTSDGWAGRDAVGLQHAAFAPLRAVEERRSVARAAATGISQLIDPYGRVLRSIPLFQHGVIVADVPLRDDRTLYSRLGDWPVGLSVLLLAAAGVLPRLFRKRSGARV